MVAMSIKLKGDDALQLRLSKSKAEVLPMLAGALFAEGNYIMGRSLAVVPVDQGVLRSSHIVMPPRVAATRVIVRFGYGGAASKYALSVHENPRSGKTGGVTPSGSRRKHWAKTGAWKFLEAPALAAFPTSPVRIGASLSRLLG